MLARSAMVNTPMVYGSFRPSCESVSRRARSSVYFPRPQRMKRQVSAAPRTKVCKSHTQEFSENSAFNRLPSDLLRAILHLIPRHPRLLVCTLVCKCWHAAALQSITSLVLKRSVLPLFPLSRLSCLTELSIVGNFSARALVLPTSLRALRVRDVSKCICALFNRLQQLSFLSLELSLACKCWNRVVTRNASSIHSLSLSADGLETAALGKVMSSFVLPNLRSLSLLVHADEHTTYGPTFPGPLVFQALLSNHLSQLTSLMIANSNRYWPWSDDDDSKDPRAGRLRLRLEGPMPCLEDVRLWNVSEDYYIDCLLAHAPKLKALRISTTAPGLPLYPLRVAHVLVEFRLDEEVFDVDTLRFDGYTRLYSLFMNLGNAALTEYRALSTQLQYWMVWTSAEGDSSVLHHFTLLHSLTLRVLGDVTQFDLSVLPASLTSLTIYTDRRDLAAAQTVYKAFDACPHLQHLSLSWPAAPARALLCKAALDAGLTHLSFVHTDDDEVRQLRKQHAWLDIRARDTSRPYHLEFLLE